MRLFKIPRLKLPLGSSRKAAFAPCAWLQSVGGITFLLLVACAGLLLIAGAPIAMHGQEERSITVRFLDPQSGKPIRKMWVDVPQYSGKPAKGPMTAEYVVSDLNLRTDQNGEILVALHDPLPAFIAPHSFDLWYSGFLIPVGEALKSGVVLNYSNKGAPRGYWVDRNGRPVMKSGTLLDHANGSGKMPPRVNPAPKPGEIVFVERRLTRWDRMRMEIP